VTVAPADSAFAYQGGELALFAAARNWRRYFAAHLRPYIGGRVLEVGAGCANNTAALMTPAVEGWLSLEPDAELAAAIRARIAAGALPLSCEVQVGTTQSLAPGQLFDTILYIDVLEHIEDDRGELRRAAAHLRPGGRLIVLAPAHQALFTPFDAAIGHYRRYGAQELICCAPAELRLAMCRMLDSGGLVASLGNRLVLRSAMPSAAQIAVWDRCLVPLSRLLDPVLGYRVGKTVIAVWTGR
jgi:SAM-dependent methyltransferase